MIAYFFGPPCIQMPSWVCALHRRTSSMNCQVADFEPRQRLRYASSSTLIVGRTRLSTVTDRAFRLTLLVSEQFTIACHFCTFDACLPVAPQDLYFLLAVSTRPPNGVVSALRASILLALAGLCPPYLSRFALDLLSRPCGTLLMTLTLTLTKTLLGSTWIPMPSLVLIGPAVRPAIGNKQTDKHWTDISSFIM